MSKVMLSFGSFIVGALAMFLMLSPIHTSTWAQEQPSQAPSLPPSTINMSAATPVVPPLQYFGHGSAISGVAQQLDGFSCDGCIVTTGLLIYGGGSYSLLNTKFPNNVQLRLVGAAENTLKLLMLTGVIPPPAPPQPALPQDKIFKAEVQITAKPNTVSLVSTAGVKK
jgi:hypothetical protein